MSVIITYFKYSTYRINNYSSMIKKNITLLNFFLLINLYFLFFILDNEFIYK